MGGSTAQVSVTWTGSAGFTLEFGETVIAVDPYLHVDERTRFVLITHDHYDHCHPPTLRRIVAGPRFERILIPRSVARLGELDSPISESGRKGGLGFVPPDRVTVVAPLHRRFPRRSYAEPGRLRLGPVAVETVDSGERPWRERPAGGDTWPDDRGPFVGLHAYPNVGYLVSDQESGFTIYHPGDLQEVFDAHRDLRGHVDVLLMPHGKLVGREISLIDAIRPRRVLPMHHRVDSPDFPVPISVGAEDLECVSIVTGAPDRPASVAEFRADQQRLIDGHWYPTPIPPMDRIRSLRSEFAALGAELVEIRAGERVRLT